MDMKRDYYEDIQLLDSKVLWFWFIVLVASLAIFPFLAPNYYIYMANYMAINVIVTVGLNILVGYTGQISLGHAGFFAIGAYMTVLSMTVLHLPFLPALLLAALIAAFFGFILGLPALRLEGPYLAIATLGFGMAITQVIGRWKVFGGRMGVEAPSLNILPFGTYILESDFQRYFLFIPITVLLIWAARNLMKTKVGRAFIAIRDSDIAAETMGVNLVYYKTLAFAVSAYPFHLFSGFRDCGGIGFYLWFDYGWGRDDLALAGAAQGPRTPLHRDRLDLLFGELYESGWTSKYSEHYLWPNYYTPRGIRTPRPIWFLDKD